MDNLQLYITEILLLLFLAITFLQSGIDKVTDFKGNISFIKNHFKNSPLQPYTSFLVAIILVLELLAGAMMLIGIFHLVTTGVKITALNGTILAAIVLICLLIGQRLAKDYVGAKTIVIYFIPTIFCVYLLNN